ncbi:MAG TPA: transglycosylase family protein [Pseudonocardiaceae bacterium]|nr:transglycosylase family protein [Pseudonocardiaceae bacterium]
MTASGDYRSNRTTSTNSSTGVVSGTMSGEVDWFHPSVPGFRPVARPQEPFPQGPRAQHPSMPRMAPVHTGTALRDRPVLSGNPYGVTTEEVLDVLGPDAEDLLHTANLNVDELISLIHAETTLLPRLDEELAELLDEEDRRAEQAMLAGEEPEPMDELVETAGKRWKKRFLKATIAAILLSATGGSAMAMAMDKDVNVDVDGVNQHIRTYSSTVAQVLKDDGITLGAHDAVSPSPTASVADGGTVMLQRGRLMKVTVDGVEQDHWTRATTVGAAMNELGMNTKGAWMSSAGGAAVPLSGMSVQVRMPKAVTLIDGANAPVTVTTTDATVGQVLTDHHISLGNQDSVNPGLNDQVTANMQINISRTGTQTVTVTQSIPFQVQQIQDSTMQEGTQQITTPGVNGSEQVTYRITSVNGKQTAKVTLQTNVTLQPVTQVVRVGTKPLPGDAVWDQIAKCESGGNWSINTGNGYYGGLQFNNPTWLSNGGGAYAPRADLASKADQIAVADKVRAARGYEPWQCAGELGIH